jgi:glutamate dehydrogenase (NADP+)
MAQNSQRLAWSSEEVDKRLAGIMESAFNIGIKTALEYTKTPAGAYPSLAAGSNIGGTLPLNAKLIHLRLFESGKRYA